MPGRHSRQIDNVSENLTARRLRESRQRRAAQNNYVQLEPDPLTRSRESRRVHSRRVNRTSLIEEANRKRRVKRMLIAAIVVAAAIIVALTVAVQVFMRTTDSRLAIDDSHVSEVLVAPKADQPFYMLCLADLKNPQFSYSAEQDDAAMLVRVDEAAKSVGFVSLPTHMLIIDPDDAEVEVASLMQSGDYSRLVQSVSLFLGVEISHITLTDFRMLEKLVDEIGGVDVNVPQEIDDPYVGNTIIRAGDNSLNGQAAMEFIRATNLFGGFEATATDRAIFTEALISKVLVSNQVELATVLSNAANYVDTDWKSSDILSTADKFKPFDSITFFAASIPCTREESKSGSATYACDDDDLEEFMNAIKEGHDPSAPSKSDSDAAGSKITIEVRNGSGVNGAAATLGAILENSGYTVKGVGNTNDDTLYPETLVVYTGTGSEAEAETVIRDIGAGRAVEGGDFYTSNADVIVIIGTDWSKS